jgi:hypothetical protein
VEDHIQLGFFITQYVKMVKGSNINSKARKGFTGAQ